MADHDKGELEFHRKGLDVLDGFVDRPALVHPQIDAVSEQAEVIQNNDE